MRVGYRYGSGAQDLDYIQLVADRLKEKWLGSHTPGLKLIALLCCMHGLTCVPRPSS